MMWCEKCGTGHAFKDITKCRNRQCAGALSDMKDIKGKWVTAQPTKPKGKGKSGGKGKTGARAAEERT